MTVKIGQTEILRQPNVAILMSGGAANPDVTVESDTETEESLDVPWQVVVHNDPINLMDYVTKVFMRIFGYPREKAEHHMMEVHKLGRSILWTGARERAEFFVQQLHSHLLMATIEHTK
jgi:ATP-dependent Clp protease adaptor protein ClpS